MHHGCHRLSAVHDMEEMMYGSVEESGEERMRLGAETFRQLTINHGDLPKNALPNSLSPLNGKEHVKHLPSPLVREIF